MKLTVSKLREFATKTGATFCGRYIEDLVVMINDHYDSKIEINLGEHWELNGGVVVIIVDTENGDTTYPIKGRVVYDPDNRYTIGSIFTWAANGINRIADHDLGADLNLKNRVNITVERI